NSTKQLASDALWCCFHTELSKVEPKNFIMAVIEDCWFQAMQDEIHEFDHLEVWELVTIRLLLVFSLFSKLLCTLKDHLPWPIKLAFKATNIILQGLPPEVYALVSNHRIAKELWEIIQLLMQGTSLTKQERECKLYDEFDKFAYKKGETLRLTVPVFKQGDNPIDAINHMMSFLSAVVTSRYPTTNNQLRNSGDKFLLQRVPLGPTLLEQVEAILQGNKRLLFVTTAKGKDTCPNSALNLKGNGVIRGLRIKCCWYKLKQMVKFYMRRSLAFLADSRNCRRLGWQYVTDLQHATVQNSNSSAQQDALILSVIEQLKNPEYDVVFQRKNHTTALLKIVGLKTYQKPFQNVFHQMGQAMEQHRLESKTFKVKMNQVLNENEQLWEQVINKDTVNIIMNSTMDNAYVNVHECKKCLKLETELLDKKDFTEKEQGLIVTALKNDLRTLKGKALVDSVVTKHTINPEMLKIDVEPIAPRLLNNTTSHSDYLEHTQEQAVILREHSKLNANSELLCVKCNGCMLSDNHDLCVLDFINDVNARVKSKSVKKSSKRKVWKPTGKVFTNIRYSWRPTGRTFTIVGNACPLTRITITAEVPLRKPNAPESDTPKPVVTLVYSRKPRKSKTNVPVSKTKIIKSIPANKKEPSKS
ncbi:hypothetical protein Tco_0195068, partial [Tanacetum coccineum]